METLELKKVSVSEFRQMLFDDDDTNYYEIINGEMVKRTAPTLSHQRLLKKLLMSLEPFCIEKKLGEMHIAPTDVFFDKYNQTQPDLIFVADSNKSILSSDISIEGIPDLLVEIISPSSVIRDRIDKKNLYERMKVPEYWLVDPQYEEFEIYVLSENKYELFSAATTMEGEFKSKVFEGLTLNLIEIFA